MVSLNRAYLSSAPWMVFFPGAFIAITVFVFNICGDALRDRLDPELKI
jgi:glutathione transport system permease protein